MATDLTPAQLRKAARDFALKALQEMKTHRMYAMTPQAEIVLASLARAMFLRREIEGRKDGDGKSPSAHKEFFGLVEALSKAGCNILQARPTNPKPLPQVWRNPLNNEPLPPPKGVGERSLLQKLDPDLLQWFDRLEKEPYKAVAEMRQAEAQREAMSAIEYDESTHLANPFCRNDESAKANLFKRDPMLAQFCKAESEPVRLDLFGAQKDLTVRGRLTKDPAAATVVELAEKIEAQWRMEDKAQAAEAKTAAEKKLAELSASEPPEPLRLAQRARIGAE